MYEFKTKPFNHQADLFNRTCHLPFWGLLWEQGCGKSKPLIDTASKLFLDGEIDGVLVVAPATVDRNWLKDEIPAHMPDKVRAKLSPFLWETKKAGTKKHAAAFDKMVKVGALDKPREDRKLAWLFMNYNSFMSEKGKKAAWRFLRRRRCLYILDESDDIKTPAAKRSRSIVASGRYAPFRRIATGTPADKPFDIYTQLRFLDEGIWRRRGMAQYSAFKTHYARWFTKEEYNKLNPGHERLYDELIEYQNVDELAGILASVSDRVLKEDVLDLPEKLYTKRFFDMAPNQKRIYDKLKKEMLLELSTGDKKIEWMLVQMLRLQQITCGYVATSADEPVELIEGPNPRLDVTLEFLEKLNHPAIVWARFTADIDQLVDALGNRAVRYDGRVSDEDCERAKIAFNAGEFDYFLGNPAKGARGITVNAAKTTFYYSNSFKWRDRVQSEDRNHRIGQGGASHGKYGFGVLYCDAIALNGPEDTLDTHILNNLRGKTDIAAQITGDQLRNWI